MKKVIILFTITLSLVSCSSDESTSNPNLDLTRENLTGVWYFKEYIMADGSIDPYENSCATLRSYVEFFSNGTLSKREYSPVCTYTFFGPTHCYIEIETNHMWAEGSEIPDGIVVKFTANELHIKYDVNLAPGTETRTLVLTKE